MSCNRQVWQQLTHSMGDTTEESVGTQSEAQVMPMADTFDGRHHRRVSMHERNTQPKSCQQHFRWETPPT
eukprot:40427-Amphidinium_carterae.1